MNISPKELDQLIRNRRSVFAGQFEPGKQIPDEIILEILENANNAPTHKLTEPWRFHIFTGKGLETFAMQQSELYKELAGENFKEKTFEGLKTTPMKCSHILSIGLKRNNSVPEMEEIAAVACAVQSIYLSAEAYGIGGYWSTGGITYKEEAKQLFGLEPEDKLMGFFYLGYIKTPSVKRTPGALADKIKWIRD